MKRRNLFRNISLLGIAITILGIYGCKDTKKTTTDQTSTEEMTKEETVPFFKLSLAQWSIHKMINDGNTDPYSFAEKAKAWGFEGLEYVSQLYDKELEAADYSEEAMAAFVDKSNSEAKKHGLKNVLIMIDGQGDLATSDSAERRLAVENHYKWVDAAAAMDCSSIRVNLAGSDIQEEWISNSVDGLTQLSTYAKGKNISIIVENHGGLSSNGALLAEVMEKVNMTNCGTLPDFGNFCIKRNDPDNYELGCAEEYDKYQGVSELMPHALAVSAKANVFDAEGNERVIDYVRMLQIVKDAGYTGYIGVEYEGSELGEEAGLLATRDLLLTAAKAVN